MLQKGKDRHGYDEPRHMLSVCYMGVLARAQGGASVVIFNAVVKLIRDFEEQYRQAYFANATMHAGPYVAPTLASYWPKCSGGVTAQVLRRQWRVMRPSIGEPIGLEPHGIIARPLRGRRALNW